MYELETKVNKLILLFFMDKMEVPMVESVIYEICTVENSWLTYMDCLQSLMQLFEVDFVCKIKHDNACYYNITPDGRSCLANFYQQIPLQLRAEIGEYVKANRMYFRRQQGYVSSSKRNSDGTHTVQLKITDWTQTPININIVVPDKETVKRMKEKWKTKAADLYTAIYELLTE